MFKIKSKVIKDKKTGKKKIRYYADILTASGQTIPYILSTGSIFAPEKK